MIIFFSYLKFALILAVISAVSVFSAGDIFYFFESGADSHLAVIVFILGIVFLLGGFSFYITKCNTVPSFVAALLLGLAAQPFLYPIIKNPSMLSGIAAIIVAYILFSGGLETKWEDFQKLFWKIFSLSFFGLFVTALFFSLFVFWLGGFFGSPLSLTAAILLGAVLASTDPAAIIPMLNSIKLKNGEIKDIVVSESALTDITGTLLTVSFVSLVSAGVVFSGVMSGYGAIFTADVEWLLIRQIFWGAAFGFLGYLAIGLLHRRKNGEKSVLFLIFHRFGFMEEKRGKEKDFDADTAFFFSVPILSFALALAFNGSGYLAAFTAGLLLGTINGLRDTENYFNRTIEGFLKPFLFLLLGALVNVSALLAYAPLGIISALVFMFLIRPFAVFFSLGPWLSGGRGRMTLRELLFISFVRETGAIPAALLITLTGQGIGGDALLSIGMWVILGTLIIQPPLTPFVARKLQVAEDFER